jgi:predicted RNase H-like HicB family nuclease
MRRRESVKTLAAEYVCIFDPNEDGGYTVTCPKLPAVVTEGRKVDEARAMARDALELVLSVYRDEGRPIPPSDRL